MQRILYASNYVYLTRLSEYGLEPNDTLSLYGATQMAIWSVLEGWSADDVVKKAEVLENPEFDAMADKIYALFVDVLNYGKDATKATYTSGITIYEAYSDTPISTYTIKDTDLNRPAMGQSYYRSALMKALPNQHYGYLFQGQYAYSYTVTLAGAPAGSRVVNKDGQVQTTFTTAPGQQLEFYVEIPADKVVGATGSLTVNVATEQFRRAAPLLWLPTIETGYEALIENYFIADSATQSMTVDYAGIGGMAQVIVDKKGEQVSGHEKITTENGIIFKPIYSQLPLAGSAYEIYILSASGEEVFEGTDGEFYIDGDKLFASVLLSSAGQTSFDVLPMDVDFAQTGYRVIEKSTTAGYLGITGATQEIFLVKDVNGLVSGTVSYGSQRVKVQFGFDKLEEYFVSDTDKDFRPVAGVVFGVYNVNALADIPAGSLIGTITADGNGRIDGSSLDLPVNQQFTIKEIKTKSNLQLDTNTYYLDTTVPVGHTDPTITIDVEDSDGLAVTEVKNYLRPAEIHVVRESEIFDNGQAKFVFAPISVPNGQVGIYADAELTTLVKTLSNADFVDNKYTTGGLSDGTYYVKDLGYTPQYVNDANVYTVQVRAGETKAVTMRNVLKTNSANLVVNDTTNPNNHRPMKDVSFNLVLDGVVVTTTTTNNDGLAVFAFKVGYEYEIIQVVPVGYSIPTTNPVLDTTLDDGTFVYDTIMVQNIKTNISVNLQLNVKDAVTGLSLSGIEYALFAKEDTNFIAPLFAATSNSQGVVRFEGIPNGNYLLKETKTHSKYVVSEVQEVDLSKVHDGDTFEIDIAIDLVAVTIRLNNLDSLSNIPVNGAQYGLYLATDLNTPVGQFVIGSDGTHDIVSVPAGSYVLKQIQKPNGYVLNSASQSFTIDNTSADVVEFTFMNKPITALVRIVAVDSKSNARLPEASFDMYLESDSELTNSLGNVVTNSNGQATIEQARIGVYKLIEVSAPVGYARQTKDVRIDLSSIEDGDVVTITVNYSRDGSNDEPTITIERPVTGVFDNTVLFIVLSALMVLLGLGVGGLSLLKLSDKE